MKPKAVVHRVQSSDIFGVGYDKSSQTLGIAFNTGMIYHYKATPKEYTDLLAAESKGRWVYINLRSTERPFTIIDPTKDVNLDVATALRASIAAVRRSRLSEKAVKKAKADQKRSASIEIKDVRGRRTEAHKRG